METTCPRTHPSSPEPDRACPSQGRRSRTRPWLLLRRPRLRGDATVGHRAAFLSAGGYHHHIGLNTWESKGGHPPAPGTTGLFHTAILYPTPPGAGGCAVSPDRGRHRARWRQRPRRQRGAVFARSRPERRRVLSRPAGGRMAARAGWVARDVHETAGSGGFAASADNLTPHGEEARSAVSNHEAVAHPSRRGLTAAPQDEVFAPRPQIIISTAAVSSTAIQP